MKRQFFAIPLLLFSFCFIFITTSFAEGESCCNSAGMYSFDPVTNLCKNSNVGVPSVPTNCNQATESCSAGICTSNPLPECDNHNSCSSPSYISTHTGCIMVGVNNGSVPWCTHLGTFQYPTIPPSVSQNSVICNPANGEPGTGVNTALGCISVGSSNDLLTSILRIATGIGGGIALALILYGVFIVTTSAGMPDKLKAGSEIITSAVIGLIFILLSIFLVNLIGINILGIPGLS